MHAVVVEYRPGLPLHLSFAKNTCDRSHALIFVNGLGDSLLAGGWFTSLGRCFSSDLALPFGVFAYVTLRSHNSRHGLYGLEEDAEDIDAAIRHVCRECSVTKITLMGHSTGCQDMLTWYRRFYGSDVSYKLKRLILQGGVSDHEAAPMYAGVEELRQAVTHMSDNDLIVCMGTAMRVQRFRSLFVERWGEEDMFHSQRPSYPDLAGVQVPCLILYSLHDQYVPASVDKAALMRRFEAANPRHVRTRLLPVLHDASRPGDFEIIWAAIISVDCPGV